MLKNTLRWSGKCIHQYPGPPHPIDIFENDRYRWMQFGSDNIQSAIFLHNPNKPLLDYLQPMLSVLHFRPSAKSCFILGLGGGTLLNCLHRTHPTMNITAVEINPNVITAAHQYFSLKTGSPQIQIKTADATDFIQKTKLSTDLLFLDLYSADHMPNALLTASFYKACLQRLNPGGILVANLLCSSQQQLHRIIYNIRSVFAYRTLCILVSGHNNTVVYAFNMGNYTQKIDKLTREKKLIAPQLDLDLGIIAEGIKT